MVYSELPWRGNDFGAGRTGSWADRPTNDTAERHVGITPHGFGGQDQWDRHEWTRIHAQAHKGCRRRKSTQPTRLLSVLIRQRGSLDGLRRLITVTRCP